MVCDKFNPKDFTIEKLGEKANLSGFCCNENDDLGLDEFIHEEALDYQKEGMGVTYLFYSDSKIVGYITVAMGSIGVKTTNLRIHSYSDKVRYPAVLLGRLAVQNGFRRRSIGKCMAYWCIGLAKELSADIGCRFVVLVTKGESRIRFYKECGFEESAIKQEREMKMMYFQLDKR